MSEHALAQQQSTNTPQEASKDSLSLQHRHTPLAEPAVLQREGLFDESCGTFAEPRFGYDFSLVPAHTDMTRQAQPLLRTGTMVQRYPVNGDTDSALAEPTAEATSTTATSEPEEESAIPEETATPALIVEDSVTVLSEGQMRKSEFLAQLRAAVTTEAESAMAGTGRTTEDCPYLDYWFDYYNTQDVQHCERALRRYAPEASSATSAREYIPIVAARVRRSVETWVRTGEVTGIPEGLPGMGLLGSIGSLVSGVSSIFFKARNGGARRPNDPRVIQSQLGSGQSLESGVRLRMESAFGMDFSQVRTHTDTTASNLSNRLNARAFTVGEHIAFGSGEYRPGTLLGDALIAHEMAHVVQQSGASASVAPLEVDDTSYNALEEDADKASVGTMVSLWEGTKGTLTDIAKNPIPRLRSGLRLQRCKDKKCKVKSGPTYTPHGRIKATASGGVKTASFNMSAEFEHDPSKDFYASCCEVRQDILWTKPAEIPNHAGFKPASNFSANTWYEDRDSVGKRYGHRTGPYSECISINHYEDSSGPWNCASGSIFKGRDDVMDGSGAKTGEWQFRLRVVDTCNRDKDVGGTDTVTVDW